MKLIFRYDWLDYEIVNPETAKRDGINIMIEQRPIENDYFNDFAFYQSLKNKEKYTKVELKEVRCYHNSFVLGLRAIYRCTFASGHGETELCSAPVHIYDVGWYGTTGRVVASTLDIDVDGGEYLETVRTRQGDILDQLIFVTNRREVAFGGLGGDGEQIGYGAIPRKGVNKVVAFAGMEWAGNFRRIGFYTEFMDNWDILKPLILAREHVKKQQQQQAVKKQQSTTIESAPLKSGVIKPFQQQNKTIKSIQAENIFQEGTALEALVVGIDDDEVFGSVLSFLVRKTRLTSGR
jgi:hypothetical protein